MPVLLDLFCGAGGASAGYAEAGFEVIGIDINPQPNYPFKFIQADALDDRNWPLNVDAIHASPPCQHYSQMTKRWGTEDNHPDLIPPLRELLDEFGLHYVIENVENAPLDANLMLCGSMFGLKVRRHRLFETTFEIPQPLCDHKTQGKVIGVYGHAGGSSKRDGLKFSGTDLWREAMEIPWMTGKELAEAIPPAYTEYIGRQLIKCL